MKARHAIIAPLVIPLLFAVITSAEPHPRDREVKLSAPVLDPGAISNPSQPDTGPGAKGPPVLRAQILLARAHFSCGEIDGYFGSNLRKALAAFQSERKIPQSGRLDAGTWAALSVDKTPVLMT